ATDDTKVICVLLFVDGEFAAIQNYPPYNFDIRTTNLPEGVHTTYASAFDAAQNKGESAKVYFTVDNARATTPSTEPPPLEMRPEPRGPESVSIGPGPADIPPTGPDMAAMPTPERLEATATSAPRPGPELAAQRRPLPTSERIAFAPRLVMPDTAAAAAAPPPPVTSRAALHVGQASASRTAAPQRTRVALLGPKATRPAAPPASRPAAVSMADARIPMRTSTTAYAPTPSRTPSGQMASLPAAPVRETRGPAASYSSVTTAPAIAPPKTSSPSRTMVDSGRTATRPPAPRGSVPPTVRTDRGERYAMLPRNVVTVASPKRDAETTSSGQRVSSPGALLFEAKHVIHLGDKSVPVVFDNELLKLRTLATERGGVPVGPFREIFEHTGGVVHWYAEGKRVLAFSDNATVELKIGDDHAKVDDETVWLELAPFIKDGRTMVPFTFLKKIMDVTVRYDPKSGRIQITSNKF
ncbi:MAG: stalk domain-containing protein, partial [Armatimonadota bacterium]